MFSQFWSHFRHHPHTHKRTGGHHAHADGHHAHADGRHAHSGGCGKVSTHVAASRSADELSGPTAAAQANIPAQCVLCEKSCSFAAPRCKHGEAFKAWLSSTETPSGGARDV
ncbi:MAG: hypothetical protein LBU43_05950 [Candidatus Accumulibacter sp.]|nr:hypothetical protein [Accumulibacter sp.]